MAYLIFTSNGEEFDRRELRGTTVIGRAPDCDISVHDIALSRHHCKIDCDGDDDGQIVWRITDLHSKNGTHLRSHAIKEHKLREGDQLRIGRTRLTFRAGAFVPGKAVKRRAVVRAQDPHEALAGTVSGMVVCEPGESGVFPGLPSPKPRPADPSAYVRDDVYGMINQIVSSSWDSIQEHNSEPIRMQRAIPVAAVTRANRAALTPKPRVSFALQADDPTPREEIVTVKKPPPRRRRRRWIYIGATATLLIAVFITCQIASKHSAATAASPPPTTDAPRVDEDDAIQAAETVDDFHFTYECDDVE